MKNNYKDLRTYEHVVSRTYSTTGQFDYFEFWYGTFIFYFTLAIQITVCTLYIEIEILRIFEFGTVISIRRTYVRT